jgi:carbonic anhydrase
LDRLKTLEGEQKPFAAFLSCADSRVPVEIIFDQGTAPYTPFLSCDFTPLPCTGFGDVFITRVAGNVVTTEVTASLEFGTAVLGAKVLCEKK